MTKHMKKFKGFLPSNTVILISYTQYIIAILLCYLDFYYNTNNKLVY